MSLFWLIDPLDGTKEFIHKNGEFTVNVALIEEEVPIFGIVSAPAIKEKFIGLDGAGIKNFQWLRTVINSLSVQRFLFSNC